MKKLSPRQQWNKQYVAPSPTELRFVFLVLDFFDQGSLDRELVARQKHHVCDLLQVNPAVLDNWLRGKSILPWPTLHLLVHTYDSSMTEELTCTDWREVLEVPDPDSECHGFTPDDN